MRYLILLLASLLLVACNENEATKRLVYGFIALQSAAEIQTKTVNDLAAIGKVTTEEAEAFTRWTEPLIQASHDATGIIADGTIPFEARVTKALHIFIDAQRLAVYEQTNNTHILVAYTAVTATLQALEINMRYAQAKAGLGKTQ